VTELGLPDEFLDHGTRAEILERVGLTPQHIARDVVAMVLGSKLPHARPLPEDSDRTDTGTVPLQRAPHD
jgi:1-deoxy-D-xylulose-5-phosphate synthase